MRGELEKWTRNSRQTKHTQKQQAKAKTDKVKGKQANKQASEATDNQTAGRLKQIEAGNFN